MHWKERRGRDEDTFSLVWLFSGVIVVVVVVMLLVRFKRERKIEI